MPEIAQNYFNNFKQPEQWNKPRYKNSNNNKFDNNQNNNFQRVNYFTNIDKILVIIIIINPTFYDLIEILINIIIYLGIITSKFLDL